MTLTQYSKAVARNLRDGVNGLVRSFAYHLSGWSVGDRILASAADSQAQRLMEDSIVNLLGPGADLLHVDVGACQGVWTHQMARAFPQSRFLLIEPNPTTFRELRRTVRSGDRVINAAISTTNNQTIEFFQTVDPKGSSVLKPIRSGDHAWLEIESNYAVQTRRLDSIFEELAISEIGVLKVDTQGHDLSVLQSAGDFLRPDSIRLVLAEINFRDWYHGQESWWQLVNLLESRGYGVAQIHERRGDFGCGFVKWADILFAGDQTLDR